MPGTGIAFSTQETPVGPLTTVVDDDGAVLACGFTADLAALWPLTHQSLRASQPSSHDDLGAATKAVTAYFDGDLAAAGTVPVRQYTDGVFLAHAWEVLRTVGPGTSISYTALAAHAGRPRAVRAAAQACARNAAALFVPCHRVLRGDGTLGGYRWGQDVKRWLLTHEATSGA